jgi:tetratricopeptide (TPR) repeat protein
VPDSRVGNPVRVRESARKNPKDPTALSRYAVMLMQSRDYDAAAKLVKEVLHLAPNHAEARWLEARLALRKGDGKAARQSVDALLALGKDGYETQLMSSRAAEILHDEATMAQALKRAHEFDPLQSEALYGLLELERKRKDKAAQRAVLEKLAGLEEHSGTVFRSLVHSLLDDPGAKTRVVEVGRSAIYADMYDPASHVAYALALEKAGQFRAASEAFEVALLAPGSAGDLIKAYREFADHCARRGQTAKARTLRMKAQQLEKALEAEESPTEETQE